MKALITGSKGFIGKNLKFFLKNYNIQINEFNRKDSVKLLRKKIENSDIIFHLAGENRSKKKKNFYINNYELTKIIVKNIIESKKKPPVIFSSTIKIDQKNIYGQTKKTSEDLIKLNLKKNHINFSILRLPNVFGKWSRPNHNSFIATSCYNLLIKKKVTLHKNQELKLIYIDDLLQIFMKELKKCLKYISYYKVLNIKKYYKVKLHTLYNQIEKFLKDYDTINNNLIKDSFKKKLFSTFISFVPEKNSKFSVISNVDYRGKFSEFSRSNFGGQISYFTIKPGVVRGNHYHNTKIEKFFLINGSITYVTKCLSNNKKSIFKLNSKKPEIIYSIPGHLHYFKNNSSKEATVLVWANEKFSKNKPDTYNYL